MGDWVNITAGDDVVDNIAVDRLAADLKARDEALRTRVFAFDFVEVTTTLTTFQTVTNGEMEIYVPDWADLISVEVQMKTSDAAQAISAEVQLVGGTVGGTVTSISTAYERKTLTVAPSAAESGSKQKIRVRFKIAGGGATASIKTDVIGIGNRFSE